MNTNRVQKPAEIVGDTRVIIFKAPGSAPERVQEFRDITPHICADQDEADALIQSDGWYATPAEANAARAKASRLAVPAAVVSPEVAAILADLKTKTKDECVEYAAGLGVTAKGTQNQIIEAIGAALSKAA